MSDAERFDVAVLGGGPAGAAAALSLLAEEPSLRVAIVERSAAGGPRVGEALHPGARALLARLGVWEAFASAAHAPAWGTAACWGTVEPFANDFLFHPAGRGWHLDRARFDALLLAEARRRGARLLVPARVKGCERVGGEWALGLEVDGGPRRLAARFVIDATGRRAAFARRQGARLMAADRLVGAVVFLERSAGSADVPAVTLVEATGDGWWYSAPLPGGRLVAAFMTDADLAGGRDPAGWTARLAGAPHTAERLTGTRALAGPRLVAARSQRLDRAAGLGWAAAGDAASAFDPLSAQGIVKALRSGTWASYAALDWLRGEPAGAEKLRLLVEEEFAAYLETRAEVYGAEGRFRDAAFWRRRAA